jgi:hypothetical protein
MMIIDPPSGWRYGFPKPIDIKILQADNKTLETWLIENGYPEIDAPFAAQHSRYWNAPDD